ncbi:hypothetical protein R9C00_17485 [Flammeovirgaceae bacterium SG7u.111]|nr:hypothetical protein [Flammeovirgaceae bacterium SG7u.132]WPO33496.1 hypothetical protein R9C00_17485 [Flammeovirgaceae bacterium SG7u.111]
MTKSNPTLIHALRQTAQRLSEGANYEWGHMGRCNCGHLVQTITKMTDTELVASIDHKLDEWTEHAKDYCDRTGSKVEDIFEVMRSYGFHHEDMVNLEYLKDRKILDRLDDGRKYLKHNQREDVVVYMEKMAELLEEEMEVV